MKIRNGFVSNSSSSSFIVAFPNKIRNQEQLKQYLFGDQTQYPNPYWDSKNPEWNYGEQYYSVDDIVELVFKQSGMPLRNLKKVSEEIASGWFPGYPEIDYMNTNTQEEWEIVDQRATQAAEELAIKFMEENPTSTLYVFEFSDDTPLGSAMEHGTLFDNVPHIRISKH